MKRLLALGAFAALLTSAAHGQIYNPTGNPVPPVVGNDTVWYSQAGNFSAGVAQINGFISCVPIFLPIAQHWDRFAANITTQGAANLQYAIYAGGLDGTTGRIQPQGAPLVSSGNIANTSLGLVVWSLTSQAVGPGIVFGCTQSDGTVVFSTASFPSAAGLIGTTTQANALTMRGLSYAGAFGTWPNFTGVTMNDIIGLGAAVVFGYRVSTVP